MHSKPPKDVTVFGDSFWSLIERDQTCFCQVLLQKDSTLRYACMLF